MLQSQKVKFQAVFAGPGAIQQSRNICLLGFTAQTARTKIVENKELSILPHDSVTLDIPCRHRIKRFWFYQIKQTTQNLTSPMLDPCVCHTATAIEMALYRDATLLN